MWGERILKTGQSIYLEADAYFTGWHIKQWNVHAFRRLSNYPSKQMVTNLAVRSSAVKLLNILFNMTTFHCNDRGQLFTKLPECAICIKHVCSSVLRASLYVRLSGWSSG